MRTPGVMGVMLPAVRDGASLNQALDLGFRQVLLERGSLLSIVGPLAGAARRGVAIFVNLDAVEGLAPDSAALAFLATDLGFSGVLSVKPHLLQDASRFRLRTIQRIHALDSTGLAGLSSSLCDRHCPSGRDPTGDADHPFDHQHTRLGHRVHQLRRTGRRGPPRRRRRRFQRPSRGLARIQPHAGFLTACRPDGRLTPSESCGMNNPASDWRDTEGKSPDLCAPTGARRLGLFSCIRPPKEVQKGRPHPAGVIARDLIKARRRK